MNDKYGIVISHNDTIQEKENKLRKLHLIILLLANQITVHAAEHANSRIKIMINQIIPNSKLEVLWNQDEIVYQQEKFSGIQFFPALKLSLLDLLTERYDAESPFSISVDLACDELKKQSRPCYVNHRLTEEAEELTKKILQSHLQKGFTIDLLKESRRTENLESAEAHWRLLYTIPSLSDHLYFGIIERKTGKSRLYGFN